MAELGEHSRGGVNQLAAVVDVRSRSFFADLPRGAAGAARQGLGIARVIFLDATDEALVRRFESVRRPHPLQGHGRMLDGIARERDAAGRPARRGRRGHRHLRPQRPRAAAKVTPDRSRAPAARGCAWR